MIINIFKSIEAVCTLSLDANRMEEISTEGVLCFSDLVCGFTNKTMVEAGVPCGNHTASLDNTFGGYGGDGGYWYDYFDSSWSSLNFGWSSSYSSSWYSDWSSSSWWNSGWSSSDGILIGRLTIGIQVPLTTGQTTTGITIGQIIGQTTTGTRPPGAPATGITIGQIIGQTGIPQTWEVQNTVSILGLCCTGSSLKLSVQILHPMLYQWNIYVSQPITLS